MLVTYSAVFVLLDLSGRIDCKLLSGQVIITMISDVVAEFRQRSALVGCSILL